LSPPGIAFYLTNNTVIQNCTVYNTYVRAIGGCGTNNTVTGNVVYGAVLENSGRGTSGGWSQAVSYVVPFINVVPSFMLLPPKLDVTHAALITTL